MKHSGDVLLFLKQSEKAALARDDGKYVFIVRKDANKIDVKHAVEKVFNVKVKAVNTSIAPSKPKRLRFRETGKTAEYKKAVVTLEKGHKITEGE